MERWLGRTAVVTGASAGIGAAVCVALANSGMHVVGLARRTSLVDDLTSKVTGCGRITSRKCDVSNLEEISAAFSWVDENLGGVDVLVNNAGVYRVGHLTEIGNHPVSDDDVLSTIDVNFRAVVMCARRAVASMRARDVSGHIVNINSVAGHYDPISSMFNVYPATKHAVISVCKALLSEVADFKRNIKITSISPGLVDTKMAAAYLAKTGVPALRPSDVADAVLYAVGTSERVNISEITLCCVGEKLL